MARSGVMSHRMHCHTAAAVMSVIDEGQWLVATGFMGDPIQGARAGVTTETTSEEQCITYLLNKYRQTRESFERMFPTATKAGILEDLRWLFRDTTSRHEPRQFDEFFFVVERQPKLITHIFNAFMRPNVRLAYPYMDGQWARFFLGLAQSHRSGRTLFVDSLRIVAPSLWVLPSLGGGAISTRPKHALINSTRERINLLQKAVECVSFGRLSMPDPCQTENVRHILRTILRGHVRTVVRHLRADGLLPEGVANEVHSLTYRHLDAFAGYRLISLADVLNRGCG
jgi:hypothetical protein